MKIIYLTSARLPTQKAHGLAAIKLCEALAGEGAEVTIIAPRRVNPLKADVYDYYKVRRNFDIRFLPTIDFLWLGAGERFFFLVQLFSFSVMAALWLWLHFGFGARLRDTVIFSHDHAPLFFASFFAPKIFYDIHHYPAKTPLYMGVLRKSGGVAVQTKWKAAKLAEDFGIPEEKIIYWPNGTDVERFDVKLSKEEARRKLNLPPNKRIALYAGSLQRWKGVETLIAAAALLSEDILIFVVGGDERDIAGFKTGNPRLRRPALRRWLRQGEGFGGQAKPETRNLVFAGQRPWAEIPIWLKAADVLVLPNTGKEKVSLFYTSPMKLFEYMASGRPIVASDIPSIREVVGETMVFFAEADNPQSFASAIRQVLVDSEEARRRANKAFERVRAYTWPARARVIIAAIERMC